MGIIYPVILPVPEKDQILSGREKVLYLSRHARKALAVSARKNGFVLTELVKDDQGAPKPFDGKCWSITHKDEYVGGVVSPARIGIDIEKIKSCSKSLFKKTASQKEWSLSDEEPDRLFFRYWTAKEAVIKANGTGIKDLLKCNVIKIMDKNRLVVGYMDNTWIVEHFFFNGHIASVVKNSKVIEWVF
ncbi:4'-phosphopantetheinyl transferase [Desulfosarcina sp. BuS5]|uniref:4'-phosphopantetheinyl transferase family protein n=1 Tax=Desulfosarcina sp. BuS5 TaxID=933262 RepID=UPI0004852AB0|nr:4'-phosphopantetheinyl transferase superfamily protein [Desulfosarcina sp. BuS5]WDN90175.1 4'-phosphopantetheinyl transferase [Desulfosarcina sp. BuS5]